MSQFESRLADMGVTLPDAPAPAANYVPSVRVGDMLYVSGQVSMGPDGFITGKLGADMETNEGAQAARTCAISLLAQVKAACDGDLDRLQRVVKLTGFVNSTPEFGEPLGRPLLRSPPARWCKDRVSTTAWLCGARSASDGILFSTRAPGVRGVRALRRSRSQPLARARGSS